MRIVIEGTVQGVGFRPSVYRAATEVGASGTVRNEGSEVLIDTDRGDALLDRLMETLPPLARIDSVRREDVPYDGPSGFSIAPSDGSGTGASIPADSAVCDRCLGEMLGTGRRSMYPFTTCTDCGPRFTLLKGIPYDRDRTSMDRFPMCPACGREFSDPADRRFHHQTIACPECGPTYRLETLEGTFKDDPIGRLAEMLDSGARAVVKGWGGTHICCTLDRIDDLRTWYRREQKPFAIMVRDMDVARRLASPTPEEERMLLSPGRPIVLCRKIPSVETEAASPGLDNIGLFLPYAGMHHILFSRLKHDALVMTSANPPGEPMAVSDAAARSLDADAWLLHDQEIVNRADDTVLRMLGDRTQYIRRSRGSVPYSLEIGSDIEAIALGAQENLTGSVLAGGSIWPTQYIGNGEKIGVPEYLEEAVRTQMAFLGCEPDLIVTDIHPGYSNRRFAARLSEETGAEILEVQHHWAHAASLLVDNEQDDCIALALDGTGHGDDGTAWGGEVLDADFSRYGRVGHLQGIPLLGGEKAVRDIRRLAFAIDAMNGTENSDFNERDASVLMKLMDRSVRTSSMGRLLDALSYRLGACTVRTYDGEPAMKLEPLLNRGRLIEGYETRSIGGTVQTAELFSRIDPKDRPEDVAFSIVNGVIGELVAVACEADPSAPIGLTGGVSYNGAVARIFEDTVIRSGRVPLMHRRVPNGDGGISVGQAAIAARRNI